MQMGEPRESIGGEGFDREGEESKMFIKSIHE